MAAPKQQPTRSFLEYALAHAASGFRVFPLAAGDKQPRIAKKDGGNGCHDATTDAAQIRAWWAKYPNANIGIAGGDGLMFIDEDTYKDADTSSWNLPPTRTARSARGGFHRYYAYDGILPCVKEGILAPGVCIKADGGYVVAPGSIFEGKRYEWVDEDQPIAQLPERIAEMIRNATARPETPATPQAGAHYRDTGDTGDHWLEKAMARTGDGQGDAIGFWLAQQLLIAERHGASVDVRATLREYARQATMNPRDPFDERDVERWYASAARSRLVQNGAPARSQTATAPHPPLRLVRPSDDHQDAPGDDSEAPSEKPPTNKQYRLTEQGNAARLFDMYGANIAYSSALGFCVWDGKRWRQDPEGLTVYKWAQVVVSDLYREAGELAQQAAATSDPEGKEAKQLSGAAKSLLDWARQSSRHAVYCHMREIIKPHCEVDPNIFDADPWLFNCANGTIDLKTGKLRPHSRTDYLMRMSPVEYDPHAHAPRWEQFLDEIMLERRELVDYLQRALGYTLTGKVSEQVWHLLHGGGENGKGTLMEAFGEIMDDFTQEVEPDFITLGGRPADPNAPSPVAANLKGKRFVKITETAEGARIDAAKVKKLSGGDMLTGRHLNKGVMRFRPTHKLWIYTNHKLETREMTHAFWRRVRFIPFDADFVKRPELKDVNLDEKLRAEHPGILAWLVRGCLQWQREGLNPPEIVLQATAQYKREMQPLRDFLSDCCVFEEGAWTPTKALWKAYGEWGKDSHARRVLAESEFKTTLAAALKERDCTGDVTRKYETKNAKGWLGVRLRTDEDPDPEDDTDRSRRSRRSPDFQEDASGNSSYGGFTESGVNGVNGVNGERSELEATVTAYGEAWGWPKWAFKQGANVPAGAEAWRRFTKNATTSDLAVAVRAIQTAEVG